MTPTNNHQQQQQTSGVSFSAILRHHHEHSDLKVDTIARAFLVSETTAYELLEGRWDGRIDSLRHGIRRLPEVGQELLEALTPGHLHVVRRARELEREDLDINRDGRTDGRDAAAGALRLTEQAVDALRGCQERIESKALSQEIAAELNAKLQKVKDEAQRLQDLVSVLTPGATSGTRRNA